MVAIDTLVKIPKEAKGVLREVASGWTDVADLVYEVRQMKGAMTNAVYEVLWRTASMEERKVLVRVYGDGVEAFFDREEEIRTFECVSKHGQGPRLLGRFQNGRVEEFLHARTLSASDLRDPIISALIASKLKEFHELDMPGPKNILIWNRLRNWLKTAKQVCPSEEAEEFNLENLEGEITNLEGEISDKDEKIGFCHNDLQYGNIMMDEVSGLVTLIDYEYASFNPVAYDIANHFCEMAANYHTDEPHILDYSKYPDLEERRRFVQIYLTSSDEKPNVLEVEKLVESVEKYKLATHLAWGLWGVISAHVNDIDFDYMEYARQRFHQYWLNKS
ncbi:hypothetical protein LUZ60_000411 [Juncus effusus]|nr:hypothetical protein LUZ60_000411 [Juncus effusus]